MRRRAIPASASVRDIALGLVPDAKPGARRQGATARGTGRAFEAAIQRVNAWYHDRGEAAIERVPLPTDGWGPSLRVTGHSTVDFTGTVHGADWVRGIAFDAKVVSGMASYRLGAQHPDRDTIEKERRQLAYLIDRRDRFGYAVALLLYCNELTTCWALTDLDAIVGGDAVPIRTKQRGAITHHLPHLAVPLELAAFPALPHGRPRLDYLSLLIPSLDRL